MRSRTITALLVLGATLAIGAFATAQSSRGTKPKREHQPILTRHATDHRDWTIITEVKLHGFKTPIYDGDTLLDLLRTSWIKLDSLDAVFPLIRASAMHDVHADAVMSGYFIDRTLVDADPQILPDYQGPTDLLMWSVGSIFTPTTRLHIEIPITSYNTRIDEKRAFKVPWFPEDHKWEPHIAANLKPQLFVESEHPAIQHLVREWTKGKPRKAGYYYLAKYLAGRVVEHYQPSGRILESSGRGATLLAVSAILVSGFRVDGAVHAAETGEGSPLDMANLLTAVYRAAGIPARVVIAHDIRRSNENDGLVVRAWTEFYLYDPRTEAGEWIPVDIQLQRQFSSRMPPIKQRWQFFGHNEEFQFTAPIAHHWHPPASVTNQGPPALWGWVPRPGQPFADQELRIMTIGTPIRGDGKPARPIPSR